MNYLWKWIYVNLCFFKVFFQVRAIVNLLKFLFCPDHKPIDSDCQKHYPSQLIIKLMYIYQPSKKILLCCRTNSNLITHWASITCNMVKKRGLGLLGLCLFHLSMNFHLWALTPQHTLRNIAENSSCSISSPSC